MILRRIQESQFFKIFPIIAAVTGQTLIGMYHRQTSNTATTANGHSSCARPTSFYFHRNPRRALSGDYA